MKLAIPFFNSGFMHISIHQSLIRKQLFLGANKKAVYALSVICVLPLIGIGGLFRIYKLTGFISFIACVLTWILGMLLLRLVARYDEEFFAVAWRYLKYQKSYQANTSLSFRKINKFKRRNWKS